MGKVSKEVQLEVSHLKKLFRSFKNTGIKLIS